jgi:ferric-dicitrate binding protein FerR (iron transport regulator)
MLIYRQFDVFTYFPNQHHWYIMQSRAYPRHHEELKMQKEQANNQAKAHAQSSRRGFFMGAAAAGAAAAAVTAMPGINTPSAELNKLPPAPENGGGYSLSEHVKRYYQTTRV